MQIAGVADVAVVGVPDTLSGEVPKAFVVKKPGVELTEQEISSYVEPKVRKLFFPPQNSLIFQKEHLHTQLLTLFYK